MRPQTGGDAPVSTVRDRLWTGTVDRLDRVLRNYYHVYEYCDDPDCVFRVALERCGRPVLLPDDTDIESSDLVGCLHFWNRHLPRFSQSGPDLGWAKGMHSRLRHSLETLCAYIETEPAWRDVKAVRADAPLPLRPRARQQLRRLAQHHGFVTESMDGDARGSLHAMGENMLLWGFARAYNPAALTRHHFQHGRETLWLSRTVLMTRYGPTAAMRALDQNTPHP
ncbi:MAG: hypothetical protein RQ966_11340 [Acetobacteraceae bacterium]|nr:hypothetical protein [Acetobacteraceae bacterium]